MDRVFLDANVLFSAAWSTTARMRRLWTLPSTDVELIVSDQAIAEARRNLPPSRHSQLDSLLQMLEVVQSTPCQEWRSLPDVTLPDSDLAISQSAVQAKATHLLTGDRRHFGPYYGRIFEGTLVLPPSEYPTPGTEVSQDSVRG